MNKNKFIILLIILVGLGAFSWFSYYGDVSQKDTVNIHEFPQTIGSWTSAELTITPDEYAILETKNAFSRKYTNADGRSVYLSLVYSQHNRKVSHPPEVCYTGSGVTIVEKKAATLNAQAGKKDLRVNQLLLEQGDYRQILCYWFKVGDTYTPSYGKQQLLIAFKTLTGKPAGSALIKISSNIETTPTKTEANIQAFTELVMPLIEKYLP